MDNRAFDSSVNGEVGKLCQEVVDLENGKTNESNRKRNATHLNNIKNRPVRKIIRRIIIIMLIISILTGLSAIIFYFLGWKCLIQLYLVAIVAYLATGKYRWFYVAFRTAPRDVKALFRYVCLLIQIKRYSRQNLIIADLFSKNVKKHPQKQCIIYEDQEWTFKDLEDYSNRIANIFKSHGYKKNDIVALFMENKPEYIGIWLGLSKIGVIVPLINTNQRLNSLTHSIKVANSQAVIFGGELTSALNEILNQIESKVALYQLNGNDKDSNSKFKNLDNLLNDASPNAPVLTEKVDHHDHLVYIYTSGTTGLPKAAVISNARYLFIAGAIHWLCGFKHSDRFYTPLPLYHTAGGCMSVGQMLIFGSTLIIRKKFSASAYFSDCQKYNCTIAQYIGEMCRYILAVSPKSTDTNHNVRMIFGNGLRPQIWKEFIERFNISNIGEFYGATEGNANIVNIDNTVGAIGFVSRILPQVYPICIIKVDPINGEPIRNSEGFCIPCKPNEPGVFIGKIIPNDPSRAFLGYVDKEASKKKVIYDVFTKGDSVFLSGDILVSDEMGYLYFKDRTGDTFRWKGENVSTAEVEAVISNIVNYKDVIVYGVEIKRQEGRAGMAAIFDPDETINMNELANGIRKQLPSYARPIFIRILKKLDMTGTFKLKKVDLQKDGFNPANINDSIYYLDQSGYYSLLNNEIYEKINNDLIRL